MADNSRPVAEPLQKSAQAAQAVRGAVKTGKAIAGAAKGAAAGGVWGAVAGFAWENRKFVGKVIIAATAVLMIPILILCMLPGIIFGGFGNSHSPADPDTPIMNSSAAIDSNLVEISTAVSCVLSEALTDMVDDTGLLVDAYNTTEIGEADCTRISVMAKEDFPKWLNEREKSLKTISDF